ncbi:MAG: hypothetical protein ACKOTA_11380, partial [Solirubrobacterales bacterium]
HARGLAAGGAPHGTLVTASFQGAGRGRQGRSWEAPAGQALLMSLVLREPSDLLPLAAAVAHTPEAEEVLRGARTKLARKPGALSRELLRNFPKGRGRRGRRRRRRRGKGNGTGASGNGANGQARQREGEESEKPEKELEPVAEAGDDSSEEAPPEPEPDAEAA